MKQCVGFVKSSSNIIEGIKAVLFFYERISHAQKAQKAQDANKQLSLRCFLYAQKAHNVKQATFTQTFYTRTKSTKSIKSTKR